MRSLFHANSLTALHNKPLTLGLHDSAFNYTAIHSKVLPKLLALKISCSSSYVTSTEASKAEKKVSQNGASLSEGMKELRQIIMPIASSVNHIHYQTVCWER